MSALSFAKQAIRKQVLAARAAIDQQERARLSAIITGRMLEQVEVQNARCVLAYVSFGHEFSTAEFIARLQAGGGRLVLPRIDRAAHRLELHEVTDLMSQTKPGVWGIREPDPARCAPAPLDAIDLIVVPGVAFTAACDRLGYGGGYYDELLSRWELVPACVAAAFDVQIVDTLPVTARDQAVDVVVTPNGVYRRFRV